MADTSRSLHTTSRAWYDASIPVFLQADPDAVVGQLTRNSSFAVLPTQRDAWLAQIHLLQEHLNGLEGALLMEFSIPRMGRRIDAVILTGPVVFVVEFKVGDFVPESAAVDQVWDYALDLKNFHEASHAAPIVPVLVASGTGTSPLVGLHADDDGVYRPISITPAQLRGTLEVALRTMEGQQIDQQRWSCSPYRPTPTIVEAARALYAQHSVEAIARYDAGAQNLRLTSCRIEELVDEASVSNRKIICFVTGVPGAGKTLVGLNVATRRRDATQPTHAVYLSGNGPLVAVLREALTRDELVRQRDRGLRIRRGKIAESVKAFIQNVHHFRDDVLIDTGPPAEHVAIFDEAQRAWTLQKTANFMHQKKGRPGFSQSEPEFLISSMDRHQDWAAIICLVGGGQEINTGEAGIEAWIQAVDTKFPHWDMYVSSRLADSEYAAGGVSKVVHRRPLSHLDDCLHLAVSLRSFRAENLSSFVKALLDCEREEARKAYLGDRQEFSYPRCGRHQTSPTRQRGSEAVSLAGASGWYRCSRRRRRLRVRFHPPGALQLADRYPIMVTRDLSEAKTWVRNHARGTERYGLVASSKAHRLKPDAIDIRVDVNPVHWFLNGKDDTRSSYYLEDAATEFQMQGLELDWTCVAWDADLRSTDDGWSHHRFRGDRWCRITSAENRRYLRNAYRVLLTRARQGMVIYVPPGDARDPTRSPGFYDTTYHYIKELGISDLG